MLTVVVERTASEHATHLSVPLEELNFVYYQAVSVSSNLFNSDVNFFEKRLEWPVLDALDFRCRRSKKIAMAAIWLSKRLKYSMDWAITSSIFLWRSIKHSHQVEC